MCLAFVDPEKAFDRAPRAEIWKTLYDMNVSNKFIRVIHSLHKVNLNYILLKKLNFTELQTKDVLSQAGVLSPLLFIIYINEIIKSCTAFQRKHKYVP